jgi:hypothetical protein
MEFRDPIIKSVVEKFVQRSDTGFKKYGVTLQDDGGNALKWLDHLQEELMDAVNYIEKLKSVLQNDYEDAIIRMSKERDWQEPDDGHMLDNDNVWQ